MNIECGQEVIDNLANAFRFNDAVLRNLIIRRDQAITEASPLLKSKEGYDRHDDHDSHGQQDRDED